ncbi:MULTISPECIES: hypothetical protein [Streptomyces]|nr:MULTISPECIES: hypothetical protein [Streptomyces]NEA01861.1 hypothetical protein [Streptomyces sp. SID10116]MYY83776.1 hypothetical protein [Streptomyces sp. SID335]MYZ18798.1 hypothetical protein [Streptomyces sp. SID337]NDZ87940.1 hypothetical protein [Streptomyces sp. SID10115]NEB48528.1 hypothetical protein [Streptomyces sp. SID339]
MLRRIAVAFAVCAAAGVISSGPAMAADPGDDRPGKYVITAVNQLDSDRLPTCYRDLYATPSATICH